MALKTRKSDGKDKATDKKQENVKPVISKIPEVISTAGSEDKSAAAGGKGASECIPCKAPAEKKFIPEAQLAGFEAKANSQVWRTTNNLHQFVKDKFGEETTIHFMLNNPRQPYFMAGETRIPREGSFIVRA